MGNSSQNQHMEDKLRFDTQVFSTPPPPKPLGRGVWAQAWLHSVQGGHFAWLKSVIIHTSQRFCFSEFKTGVDPWYSKCHSAHWFWSVRNKLQIIAVKTAFDKVKGLTNLTLGEGHSTAGHSAPLTSCSHFGARGQESRMHSHGNSRHPPTPRANPRLLQR